jgi:hypothetical protein
VKELKQEVDALRAELKGLAKDRPARRRNTKEDEGR